MALLDFLFLQHPVLVTAIGLVVALVVSSARARSLKDYPDLPWVGRKSNGFGATTYANWMSASHTREWLTEGYNKVSSVGLFLLWLFIEKSIERADELATVHQTQQILPHALHLGQTPNHRPQLPPHALQRPTRKHTKCLESTL